MLSLAAHSFALQGCLPASLIDVDQAVHQGIVSVGFLLGQSSKPTHSTVMRVDAELRRAESLFPSDFGVELDRDGRFVPRPEARPPFHDLNRILMWGHLAWAFVRLHRLALTSVPPTEAVPDTYCERVLRYGRAYTNLCSIPVAGTHHQFS